MARTFWQHLVSFSAVMLSQRDPYQEPYRRPEVTSVTIDRRGRPVIHVQADNYIDAAKPIEGTTYPGNVYRRVGAKGGREWEIRVADNNSNPYLEETRPRKAVRR